MGAFHMPTRTTIEPGCLSRLPDLLTERGLSRTLLVIDRGLSDTPWPDLVRKRLSASGATATLFDEVEANPRTTTANRAAALIREEAIEAVVALGGGSALDAGKAAAMLAVNPGDALNYEGKNRFPNPPLPFFAVPTTCGTGSEVTWVAVLTDEDSRRKISVKGVGMFPDCALVDANLLRTLPARLVAWTGMDALTHALEATTGRMANPVSDAMAEKAIALLFAYLPRAAEDIEGDGQAREAVARAATLAGMAFGNADVGGVHCVSESIGALYDTPHGLANAILLAPMMRYHLRGGCLERRFAELCPVVEPGAARDARPADLAERFLSRLEGLSQKLAIPAFASLSIPAGAFSEIAALAASNGSNDSNPQPMDAGRYREFLDDLA